MRVRYATRRQVTNRLAEGSRRECGAYRETRVATTSRQRHRKAAMRPRRIPADAGSPAGRWAKACGGYRDRKSTRLNSSHQIISYAVFCLKKKNIRDHTDVTISRPYP